MISRSATSASTNTYPHLCKLFPKAEVEHQGGGLLPASSAKQQASQEASEKPSSKGALQKLRSCREALAGTRTSSLLGEQQKSHNAFPAELLKCIPSPGAAGSSSHPRTAEQDTGLSHLDSAQPQPETLGQSLVNREGCCVQGCHTFPLQK